MSFQKLYNAQLMGALYLLNYYKQLVQLTRTLKGQVERLFAVSPFRLPSESEERRAFSCPLGGWSQELFHFFPGFSAGRKGHEKTLISPLRLIPASCPAPSPTRASATRHSIPIPAPILRVPSHRRLRSPRAIPRRFLGSPLAGRPDPRQVRASISPSRIAISFRLRRWALVDRSGGGFWAGRRTAVALDFLVIAFLRLVLDRRTRARNFVLCL